MGIKKGNELHQGVEADPLVVKVLTSAMHHFFSMCI
jgi:hypothetical protein